MFFKKIKVKTNKFEQIEKSCGFEADIKKIIIGELKANKRRK
tara:strand:- start:8 stop:133 length:126 start_codon:yes stop_codon:yes gene_type:complete